MPASKLVTHTDLDGIMSAAIYQLVNPGSEIIGTYDFKRIEFVGDWTLEKTRNNPDVLYLDLDIARYGYQSMGHHICSPDNSVVLPNNPNYHFGVTDLRCKFPMNTALMLTEQYHIAWSKEQMQHLWMIDGAVCNYIKYTPNVLTWLDRMPFLAAYGPPSTPTNLHPVANFCQSKISLSTMQPMIDAITELTGLTVRVAPGDITTTQLIPWRSHPGGRNDPAPKLTDDQILTILKDPQLFSSAIINQGIVSCTYLPMQVGG